MSGLLQPRSKPSEGLTDPFRVLSTSSGAACWTWPRPLPHNPTRDDLASTRATLLDLTTTQPSATRGLSITLMWLDSMTEWIMWQSCLCTWNMLKEKKKRDWDTHCKVAHCQYPCPQLHLPPVREIPEPIVVSLWTMRYFFRYIFF